MRSFTITLLCFFVFASLLTAQGTASFGDLTAGDIALTAVKGDKDAHAVMLYEKGDNYFDIYQDRIWVVKEYHAKIKILDKEGFGQGTVSIPYRRSDNLTERVENLRAVTHNGSKKISVLPAAIFTNTINSAWSEKKFTFPDIGEGSVLEYRYKILSPFIYYFNGWQFQSEIPKIYSEFNAKIPGNYRYNRNLAGSLALKVNDAKLVKECFRVPGTLKGADCEVLKYVMTDIPAFKTEEFMLAPSNYISRIDFELSEHYRLDGVTDRYTKSWADVDKEFKNDRDIGRQLTKKGYFEKFLPEGVLEEKDALKRAEGIYNFVRGHYTWNGGYGIYDDIRVKEAFDSRKGNIGEINISLINLLNVAGIKTNLMLISTRNNGLPKKTHPVMADFNYIIASAEIEGKTYLLDASDPYTPFAMLPFRCLNYYGRLMDFKEDSRWQPIAENEESRYTVRAQVNFDTGQKKAVGILDELNTGYEAVNRRKEIAETGKEAYIDGIEGQFSGNLAVTSYEEFKDKGTERLISERTSFEMDNLFVGEVIYFNPFLVKFFEMNPFLAADRQFPIDFGYERQYSYNISITVPEGYTVEKLPAKQEVSLPNKKGVLKFESGLSGNNISFYYTIALNSTLYSTDEYHALKSFFARALDVQNNSMVVLNKTAQ